MTLSNPATETQQKAPVGWTLIPAKFNRFEGQLTAIHTDGTEAWINRSGELEVDSDHQGARVPVSVLRRLLESEVV